MPSRPALPANRPLVTPPNSLHQRWFAVLLALFTLALLQPKQAEAECGGQKDCIAIALGTGSIPAHGTPLAWGPIDFGARELGVSGTSGIVTVAAVLGPADVSATLGNILIDGPNASEFAWSGSCYPGMQLPRIGVSGPPCEIQIAFNPLTTGAKSATLRVSSSSITRSVSLTGIAIQPAPVITSALETSGSRGSSFSYQITATNDPTSFSASGLPSGLSFNTSSGLISGTPEADGSFNVQIRATNSTGSDQATLVITVAVGVPEITSPTSASGRSGEPFSYQIEATQGPESFGATGLPNGLTVDGGTGLISGTPLQGGEFTLTLTASNPSGTATQVLVLTIDTSLPEAQDADFQLQINTTGHFDLSSLVSGLNVSGLRLVTDPNLGSASIDGLTLVYTPHPNTFGNDSLQYVAVNADGDSAPATVRIAIVGRPDPLADRDLIELLDHQARTSRRFAGAQIDNVNRRMERMHQRPSASDATISDLTNTQGLKPQTDQDMDGAEILRRLASAAEGDRLNLASSLDSGSPGAARAGDTGVWVEGSVRFGDRDPQQRSSGLTFTTEGVTVGADRRLSADLLVGGSLGYARDEADMGESGTRTEATGNSVSLYASYQPIDELYLDAVLGYGHLEQEVWRALADSDEIARTQFDSKQWFGSLSAGWLLALESAVISPYGRLDWMLEDLDESRESGGGSASLGYSAEQRFATRLALGLRASAEHVTDFGTASPNLRLEFRHQFDADADRSVWFLDDPAATRYAYQSGKQDANSLLIGLGSDFTFHNGLKLGIGYEDLITFGEGQRDGVLRLWLDKELNAKPLLPDLGFSRLLGNPLQVEFGGYHDSNLNRVAEAPERLSDSAMRLRVGQTYRYPLARTLRLDANASLSAERFRRFRGLDFLRGDLRAELLYRSSGHPATPTFGLFGSAGHARHESELRSGEFYSIGLSLRQPLSENLFAYAALSHNLRNADSDAFDLSDNALKLSLDYGLGRSGSLYLVGEYRKGDIASTSHHPLYDGLADYVTQDDAFDVYDDHPMFVNRYQARTLLWTLGYNLPLGPSDSLDISWRRAVSEPTSSALDGVYISDQLAVVYLLRF